MTLINPGVSIIVPVYNHWDLVPQLIACIADQSAPAGAFELILVDNGSDRLPDTLVLPPYARLIHCATPGSYAARNEGIARARGSIIAFTDADCRPLPNWLAAALACYKEAGSEEELIIAGAVTLVSADKHNMTPYELYDIILGMKQERYARRGYGMTANLFVPGSLFQKAGLFDATRFSGGDAEFCRRAVKGGAVLRYCAAAAVEHPARQSWAELSAKIRRITGGQLTSGPWQRRLAYVSRIILPPLRAWLIALRARGYSLRQRLIVCAIQGRLWLVEVAEMVRLLCGGHPCRR